MANTHRPSNAILNFIRQYEMREFLEVGHFRVFAGNLLEVIWLKIRVIKTFILFVSKILGPVFHIS